MNNKKLGNEFEQEMVNRFAKAGYWVHFLSPDKRGAQPFDIIAARKGQVVVGDCKTSAKKSFSIDRLEDNQILAFDRWMSCGNGAPYIFVKYNGIVYFIPYTVLRANKTIKLEADSSFAGGWWLK